MTSTEEVCSNCQHYRHHVSGMEYAGRYYPTTCGDCLVSRYPHRSPRRRACVCFKQRGR